MDFTSFEPVQFRAALFTPRLRQISTAQVVRELLGTMPQFSGDPIVLPIPADAPPQIPRVILKGAAETAEMQIALSRSDLYLNASPGSSLEPGAAFEEAAATLVQLLSVLAVRPGRLAAIGSYAYKIDDPASALAQHFCQSEWVAGPFQSLGTFELHAHHRDQLLEGMTVNSWIRCKTGTVNESGRSFSAVVIERDVNTLPEEAEEQEFDDDEIAAFMNRAALKLGEELVTIFPVRGKA